MAVHKDVVQDWGRIVVYDPAMAAEVAEMFTAFNELWPGGFSGGVPFDEQHIHDWLDKTSALADLIALDADGKPVGYCGVYPHWRDADAAYVTILGVVPRVKGRGYGKRLLLKAVEIAREKGLRRLDLHTWSGNLNAVPLYKKVGMFWVPDTNVYMQDYLPGLFQMPLAEAWFAVHPDWYSSFQRELTQAQDKYIVDGMELYPYVFQVGDDRLVAEVDRYAWGFCGLERRLGGEEISIKTRLRSHDILIGLPNAMTLAVTNRSKRDLSIALAVEPFKGLHWSEPFPLFLLVPRGESVALTREFTVDHTAETYKERASPAIRSRLAWDGQALELLTGGKIQPAVEIGSRERYLVVPAGRESTLYLDLTNHAKSESKGKVDVFLEGQAGSQRSFDFCLGPEQVSGLQIPVILPDSKSPTVLHATASVEVGGTAAAMPTYRYPIAADSPDLACVVADGGGERLYLLTDALSIEVELEGGEITIEPRGVPGLRTRTSLELGPPFGLSLDETLRFEHRVVHDGRGLMLLLSAVSRHFPDVRIERGVRVAPGMREVEQWFVLTNLRTSSVSVGGRFNARGGYDLSLNPHWERARSFTPLCDRPVECDAALPFMDRDALPPEPERWAETWTAVQSLASGDLAAWFWKPDHVAKIWANGGFLSSLEAKARELSPGEVYEVFHVWYGFSFRSLADVRQRWCQLVGHVELPWEERFFGVTTRGPVEARLLGDNYLLAGRKARRSVELRFATRYPLPGELRLDPPAGWEAAFLTPEGMAASIPMPKPNPDVPARVDVELTPPAEAEAEPAFLRLRYVGEFELDFELPLFLLGEGDVVVGERELEGKPVLAVANGALSFCVAGELGGNLIRLQDAQGRSFLADTFPQVMPKFFLEHHIGGIEPRAFLTSVGEPFGRLEEVQTKAIQEGNWKGACAWWTAQHAEGLRGQEYSVAYLTLPGSRLLRLKMTHRNPTPRRIEWCGVFLLDVAFQGSSQGLVIAAPGGTQTWVRHPAIRGFVSPAQLDHSWARIVRNGQSLSILCPKEWRGTVQAFDLQAMVGAFLAAVRRTEPFGESSAEFALALNVDESLMGEWLRALGK